MVGRRLILMEARVQKHPDYPAMLWNAAGEARVFEGPHEIPAGEKWLDHPAKHAEPAAELEMTRDEIKAALDAGEVAYAKNAKTETLLALLTEKVQAVAKERGIDAAGKSTKELLEQLTAQA